MPLRDVLAECVRFYRDTATLAFAVYRGATQRTKGANMQHITDAEYNAIDAAYYAYLDTFYGSDAERDALLAFDDLIHPIAQRLRFPEPDPVPDGMADRMVKAARAAQHPSHPDYQPLGEPEKGRES